MPNCFLISVDLASKKAYCFLKMSDCFLISVDLASKKAYCFLIWVDRPLMLGFGQAKRHIAVCLLVIYKHENKSSENRTKQVGYFGFVEEVGDVFCCQRRHANERLRQEKTRSKRSPQALRFSTRRCSRSLSVTQ